MKNGPNQVNEKWFKKYKNQAFCLILKISYLVIKLNYSSCMNPTSYARYAYAGCYAEVDISLAKEVIDVLNQLYKTY